MNSRLPLVAAGFQSRAAHLFITTVLALALTAAADEPTMKTYTFKTVGPQKVELQADVHRWPGDEIRPVIIFIHGGALMMGGRNLTSKPGSLLEAMLKAGYVVVSIDYRLAPNVKLPAIIWVRERGPDLFNIDPDNLFVMGQSAGGYLTLMTGLRVNPRPRALVSFWGYGDIAGKWYSKPDAFYRQQPLVSKDEAETSGGAKLYLYCRQQGLWPKVLTGHDPGREPRAFDAFCPVRKITPDYPPTLLIHGTKDTDVPYELSAQMDKELTAKNVAHEFITIPEGIHGFRSKVDAEIAAQTYQQVVKFLNEHSATTASSFIGNKSVEGDERGRIPLWGEEKDDALLTGRRAGKLALDSDVRRTGRASVRLAPEGDWFALASVNYPVPAWTERLELSGWARAENSAKAQIVACWTDDAQHVLRVDVSESVTGSEWQRISLTPPPPPAKAMTVRLSAVARGGQVWFDDFDLLALPPKERRIQVFVNQVGYELAGPKSAVVAANFMPATGKIGLQLITTKNKVVLKQNLAGGVRIHGGTTNDWGWYFWRADFSDFKKAGAYRVVAQADDGRGESPPFHIERDLLLKETAQNAVDFSSSSAAASTFRNGTKLVISTTRTCLTARTLTPRAAGTALAITTSSCTKMAMAVWCSRC